MSTRRHLIILFTRYPEPGRCKTRLIPALGADGAAALHKWMTERVVSAIKALTSDHGPDLEIHFDGGDEQQMRDWLGQDLNYQPQAAGDIGQRMAHALCSNLQEAEKILLLGSDCPQITAALLTEGLNALNDHDLVVGPAHDGGYYLIGATNRLPEQACVKLFTHINWGSATVYDETITRLRHLQLSFHRLPKLHDIDTADDLHHLDYRPDPQ